MSTTDDILDGLRQPTWSMPVPLPPDADVVWVDEVTPFTGEQVRDLLRENASLRHWRDGMPLEVTRPAPLVSRDDWAGDSLPPELAAVVRAAVVQRISKGLAFVNAVRESGEAVDALLASPAGAAWREAERESEADNAA